MYVFCKAIEQVGACALSFKAKILQSKVVIRVTQPPSIRRCMRTTCQHAEEGQQEVEVYRYSTGERLSILVSHLIEPAEPDLYTD